MKKKTNQSETSAAGASSRFMYRLAPATFAALFAVNACSDAVGPNSADEQASVVAQYDGAALGSLIAAESERIVPTLRDNSSRDAVAASLQQLSVALQSGEDAKARTALTHFTDAIARFDAANPADSDGAADLGALRLAVDAVRDALQPAK